jgi:hypothetical protein
MRSIVSDEQFIDLFRKRGAAGTAQDLNTDTRSVHRRRKRLELKYRIAITSPNRSKYERVEPTVHPFRVSLNISEGTVIIAGDAHYWPGPPSLMHQALVQFCKELKPRAIIFNGDVLDAPTISRHLPIGWEERPQLADEVENAKDRLHEVVQAVGSARKIWNLGNHDARFETRLAHVAPEYARLNGVHLHDHFPLWETAWATWINDDVVVKHRFKSGVHATHNGALWAGKTLITGHLHSAKVTPLTDYNGTRYGVDAGCIADVHHKAFVDYTEDNPKNWRTGFCILSFKEGKLMQPELVLAWDDYSIQFRGSIIKV